MKPDQPFHVGQAVRISRRWQGNTSIDPQPGDLGVVQEVGIAGTMGVGVVKVLIARCGQAWWWPGSNVEILPDDQ